MKFSKPAALATRLRVFFFLLLSIPASCSPSPPSHPMPSPQYIGLSKEAASAKAEAAGLRWRVVKEDGKIYRVTKDFRPERLNFDVEHGIVTRVSKG